MTSEEQLDRLYDRIDDLLLAHEYDKVNDEMANTFVHHLTSVMIVGWLTITYAAHPHLPARMGFVARARVVLRSRMSAEEVEQLLSGLV